MSSALSHLGSLQNVCVQVAWVRHMDIFPEDSEWSSLSMFPLLCALRPEIQSKATVFQTLTRKMVQQGSSRSDHNKESGKRNLSFPLYRWHWAENTHVSGNNPFFDIMGYPNRIVSTAFTWSSSSVSKGLLEKQLECSTGRQVCTDWEKLLSEEPTLPSGEKTQNAFLNPFKQSFSADWQVSLGSVFTQK